MRAVLPPVRPAAKRVTTAASPTHPPSRNRTRKSLQFVLAGAFQLEQAAKQIVRRLADEDGVRLRERLQPRGEIGGLADNGTLLRCAGADDFTDDNEPSGNTDPRLNTRAVRALDAADFRQDADRCAHGAFCRVLEGARETEIGEHAVAHEFRDEAAEPTDRASCGILVAPDQTAQQFGIDHAR